MIPLMRDCRRRTGAERARRLAFDSWILDALPLNTKRGFVIALLRLPLVIGEA